MKPPAVPGPLDVDSEVTKYESDEVDDSTKNPVSALPTAHPAMFTGPVGAAVQALAPFTEAHPVAVLVQVMAMLGAYLGDGPHVLIGGSKHPARIWPLIMGTTARGRKGESRAQAVNFVTSCLSSDSYFVDEHMTSGLSSGEGLLIALGGDKQDVDGRLVVSESEFARVLSVGRREGNPLLPMLRELWETGRARTMTKATPLRVDGAHLVVSGHVTPRELRMRLSEEDVSGGTLNRFLPVLVHRTHLLPESPPPPDLRQWSALVQTRITAARKNPRAYQFTADARGYWHRIYRALDASDTDGLLAEVLGRLPAYTQRLALLYAIADGAPRIDVPHLRAALGVVTYVRDSCALVFGVHAEAGDLGKLSTALAERGRMSRTEVFDLFGRNKKVAELNDLIGQLVEQGHARRETEQHEKGRATEWVIWTGTATTRDPLAALLGIDPEPFPELAETPNTVTATPRPSDDAVDRYVPQDPPTASDPSSTAPDLPESLDGSLAPDGLTRPENATRPDVGAGQNAAGRVGRVGQDPPTQDAGTSDGSPAAENEPPLCPDCGYPALDGDLCIDCLTRAQWVTP